MNDSVGFVLYLYERDLPYLLRELVNALWELRPLLLFLSVAVLLGVIKGLEILFWLLRRLWLPLAALLGISGLALAMYS